MRAGELKSTACSGFREEFPHTIDEERFNWGLFWLSFVWMVTKGARQVKH
jgi:hypothetical protein